jgi:hypothetical protein
MGEGLAYSYRICGLAVRSVLALPGLIPLGDEASNPDVVIGPGHVPRALDDATDLGPNWQIAADRLLIAVPGAIRMLLIAGREIIYEADGGADPADEAIWVSGAGFGILLHQRGSIVLHASGVRVGDHAVLFCGPSGGGKSTLAAALVAAGHSLVTDDFCTLTMSARGVPSVWPDGRQLKLWQNAIHWLRFDDRRAAPVRPALQKYFVEPAASAPSALPLAAIYVLRETKPPLVSGIARPNIVDASLMIRRNAYRPSLVRKLGQAHLYFEAATTIARDVGVFLLTREHDFAAMPDVLALLQSHWRERGLVELAA